jgi:hypothetical protein
MSHAVRDRLEGRRALIVVDNLETVRSNESLLHSLQTITSRDVRAIITTRTISDYDTLSSNTLLVRLNPLNDIATLQKFLTWHVQQFRTAHPALSQLESDIGHTRLVRKLAQKTGGIPLLIQVLFSSITNRSWDYLDSLPALFGSELLDFLYRDHWETLQTLGRAGKGATELLRWINREQYLGNKVSNSRLAEWGSSTDHSDHLEEVLGLLHERFMLVNMDRGRGNFTVPPSLSAFVQGQR